MLTAGIWRWWRLFLSLFIVLGAVIWSLTITPVLLHTWLSWPGLLTTSLLFLLALLSYFFLLHTLRTGKRQKAPFIQAVGIFVFAFISLAGSLYPFILPPQVNVYTAAPALTLKVMLVVMVPLLPLMLLYNVYQYKVFSANVSAADQGE